MCWFPGKNRKETINNLLWQIGMLTGDYALGSIPHSFAARDNEKINSITLLVTTFSDMSDKEFNKTYLSFNK